MKPQIDEFARRRGRIAADLAAWKLDALMVSSAPNVQYLSGFAGSHAALLLDPGGAWLFTDPRYGLQAAQETSCKVKVVRGPLYPALLKTAQRRRIRRLGYEQARLTCNVFDSLREQLYLGASLEPTAGLVERHRMVKSEGEIALIRAAVELNSEAYARTLKKIRPGTREVEIAAEIEYQMRLLGAQKPAFETIVASGPHAALPHAQPRNVPAKGLLLIDVGACREGYLSDMTRVAFLGRPGREVKQFYKTVLEAQLAGIAAVRAGARAGDIDRAARRPLRAGKLERLFIHSTGHGLGLEIHEPPRLGRREQTELAAGMVVTVEPGAYLPGWGGVRIEDTVVVTPSGCEILTPTPKELLVL